MDCRVEWANITENEEQTEAPLIVVLMEGLVEQANTGIITNFRVRERLQGFHQSRDSQPSIHRFRRRNLQYVS